MRDSERFCQRLGIRYPIIQAPMAGVSTPALAAAVAEAGGLGSLGIGSSDMPKAREMIRQTRALTAAPFNVNVFCHAPASRDAARENAWLAHLAPLFAEVGIAPPTRLEEIYTSFLEDSDTFDMLLERPPAVVSFHFGLPSAECIAALRERGVVTMATATSLAEAQQIAQSGVEAIVAQGHEAGGHRGVFEPDAEDENLSTAELVRLLVAQTSLPVIAAGGIMEGRDIRAVLDQGAVAVQMGTAFVPCPESAADESYRRNLLSARANTTRMTRVLSGRPARGMVNRLIEHGEAPGSPVPADYPLAYDAAKQLDAASRNAGPDLRDEFAAQWAGTGAPRVRELPAGVLIEALVSEWRSGS